MSTGLIIVIVVVVVVVAALVAVAVMRPKQRSQQLRQQFGPEYDRELERHDGDTKATEQELGERVRRTRDLDIRPLDDAARERYAARWTTLQEQFVDSPAKAVVDADQLLNEVLKELGYPEDDQYAALSVHHAHALPGYRGSRGAAERAQQGEATTEELRQSFVDVRETFDALVGGDSAPQATSAEPVPEPVPEPPVTQPSPEQLADSRRTTGRESTARETSGPETPARDTAAPETVAETETREHDQELDTNGTPATTERTI